MKRIVALAVALALATLLDSAPAWAGAARETAEAAGDSRIEVVRGDLEAGLAAVKGRDWALARVYLQRAVDRDPQDPDALAAMGELYLLGGNMPEARRKAEQLAALCPRGCIERSRLLEAISARVPGGS